MSYWYLLCNVLLSFPHEIEIHFQIEHIWGRRKKEDPNGLVSGPNLFYKIFSFADKKQINKVGRILKIRSKNQKILKKIY